MKTGYFLFSTRFHFIKTAPIITNINMFDCLRQVFIG